MAEKLTAVSETLYVPMAGRIYAGRKYPHIVNDDKVFLLEKKIPAEVDIFKGQTEYTLIASATRSFNMDLCIKDFLTKNPNGVIINLGCGLETMYYRCDNGKGTWFEVDLPEVIALREELLGTEQRDISIPHSMFETEWMEQVKERAQGKSVLLTAAGLFYYFPKKQVLELIRNLSTIPNAQLVFDTVNSSGMNRMDGYMKQLGHEKAEMFFFVDDANELAKEIGGAVSVVEERDYYSKVTNRKGMKSMTKISMAVSDKFHMVKMVQLKLS